MKTIIQSRKTRGFTYRHQCGEAAVNFLPAPFLMCFSLPESNSFPGPRQLHINWPRRQCQGYSAQVLRRCHRQLNIDLEVCSYSLYQPVLLSLSLLHFISHLPLFCLFQPLQSLHARLFAFLPSVTNVLRHSSCSNPHQLIPSLTYFSLRLLHPLDFSSPLFCFLRVSLLHCLSPFQEDIKQGPHSRWDLIETSAQQDVY